MFERGRRFRVAAEGCAIVGFKWAENVTGLPARVCERVPLARGEVIICEGRHWTRGDGAPVVMWSRADGTPFCEDAEFSPSTGDMWHRRPAEGCLEPL